MLKKKIKVTANEIYDQAIKCGFDKWGIIPIYKAVGFYDLYKKPQPTQNVQNTGVVWLFGYW